MSLTPTQRAKIAAMQDSFVIDDILKTHYAEKARVIEQDKSQEDATKKEEHAS